MLNTFIEASNHFSDKCIVNITLYSTIFSKHSSLFQLAADDYYDFEIVNMKSLQDWIVYMLTIPSWHFFSKNIQN